MEASDFTYGNYPNSDNNEFVQENNFVVEEFFNFSNKDDEVIIDENDAAKDANLGESANSSGSGDSSNSSGDGQHFSGELYEPQDELEDLQWVSHIVEEKDLFSAEEHKKLQLISGVKAGSSSDANSSISEIREIGCKFTVQQPTKAARSKRSRNSQNLWSSRLLVPTQSDSGSMYLVNPDKVRKCPKPVKRKEPAMMAASDGRKCLHCATDKTPQWRTGPLGPKTLCNACGVRYKSGRLVPEYRPAASPTFVTTQHSNSHRKVMELRRKKEMQTQQFMSSVYDDGDDKFLIHQQLTTDYRQLI